MLVRVGASHGHGLRLDLGLEPFNGARMGRDLGCVVAVDDAQLERVGVVRANGVVGSSVRVHGLAMRGMCGVVFGWLWQVELG